MASVTKVFVATAVMHLAEGERSSSTPLWFGTFPTSGSKMLATAASPWANRSITRPTCPTSRITDGTIPNTTRALARYVAGLGGVTLIAAPGEQWAYSNLGFELLAFLIERVSGESFEAYVR